MQPAPHHQKKHIVRNIKAHDSVATTYDSKHVEIYNITEQNRIRTVLQEAVSLIQTRTDRPNILDFGSGTGNLTCHFLELKTNVIAGDVSPKSLNTLKQKTGDKTHLKTTVLNGKNLSQFPDNSFDMVATYSVLHHVPDYLSIIDEFVRIAKPGGVIYIDHEVSPSYWQGKEDYFSYLNELGEYFLKIYQIETGIFTYRHSRQKAILNYLSQSKFKQLLQSTYRFIKPFLCKEQEHSDEGDLHTSKNDHIEWSDIKSTLLSKCKILKQENYLVCRELGSNPKSWHKWKDSCEDMRVIIARKL